MLGHFSGLNQAMKMNCLAQGHNTAPLVRYEQATLRSRVQHSTNCSPDNTNVTGIQPQFPIAMDYVRKKHVQNVDKKV